MKKIKLEKSHNNQNLIELWKFNNKGYYNFIENLEQPNIKDIKRRFKNYEIIDRQNCLSIN